jgi:hypothetical protein
MNGLRIFWKFLPFSKMGSGAYPHPASWRRGWAAETLFASSNGTRFLEKGTQILQMGPYLADGPHILQMGPVAEVVRLGRRRVLSLRGYPD